MRGASRFDFDAPVQTPWLRLTIRSVYAGAKYRDTAASELYPIFKDWGGERGREGSAGARSFRGCGISCGKK
jgi:hypothetical protein